MMRTVAEVKEYAQEYGKNEIDRNDDVEVLHLTDDE